MTSYFAIQGSSQRTQKEKKIVWQWRKSKEKERLKENGGQMKGQVEVAGERVLSLSGNVLKKTVLFAVLHICWCHIDVWFAYYVHIDWC